MKIGQGKIVNKGITIKEIAKQSGVSIGTVSRIVNNQQFGYSQETYERVKKVIKESGYMPNRIARSMVTKKSHTIGYMVEDIANPYFYEIARGISQAAKTKGFNMIFCEGGTTAEQAGQQLKFLCESGVDGIITGSYALNEKNVDFLLMTRIPLVILDANLMEYCFYNISVDNYNGAKAMTEYLIGRGHKKIACVTGASSLLSTKNRLNGYKSVMAEHGLGWNGLIVEGDHSVQGSCDAMQQLDGKDYTAVFAFNDLMAIGVCNYLQAKGIRVPKDVSVVGFDDISMSSYVYPPLTTVHQPLAEMGEGAVELLIQGMEEGIAGTGRSRIYDLTLVERESVSSI